MQCFVELSHCCRYQSYQAICVGAVFQGAHPLLAPSRADPDPSRGLPGSDTVPGLWFHAYTDSPGSLCGVHCPGLCLDACSGLPCLGAVQLAQISHHHAAMVPHGVHQWLGGSGAHAALHAGQNLHEIQHCARKCLLDLFNIHQVYLAIVCTSVQICIELFCFIEACSCSHCCI